MARDHIIDQSRFEILGAYFSPVSDSYNKSGLAQSVHRINMCELAVENSSWLMVDRWEPLQSQYVRTAKVLDHFDDELNGKGGGLLLEDGESRRQIHASPMSS